MTIEPDFEQADACQKFARALVSAKDFGLSIELIAMEICNAFEEGALLIAQAIIAEDANIKLDDAL